MVMVAQQQESGADAGMLVPTRRGWSDAPRHGHLSCRCSAHKDGRATTVHAQCAPVQVSPYCPQPHLSCVLTVATARL